MKRVILIIFAILLTACGGGGNNSPSSPAATILATSSMFSGKSFQTGADIITFNANGTVLGGGLNTRNEIWTINSSGQLVVYNTGKGTATFSFITGDATIGWTASITYSNGSPSAGTFVPVPTTMFTSSMLNGNSFSLSSQGMTKGTATFDSNGTFIKQDGTSSSTGTWSVNSAGQLIVILTSPTSGNINTNIITGNTGTVYSVYEVTTYASSSVANSTSTFTMTTIAGQNFTGNQLDMAIQGAGYFQITLNDGTTAYTRTGAFKKDSYGQIVTVDGYPLSPSIVLPLNFNNINIRNDGTVLVSQIGQTLQTIVGSIQLASFPNPVGLSAFGNNVYIKTIASGAPTVGTPGQNGLGNIIQGYL